MLCSLQQINFLLLLLLHCGHVQRNTIQAHPSVRPSAGLPVCLSVCPSHCGVNECSHRQTHSTFGRGMVLVFLALSMLQNSKGNSLSGDIKYTRHGKNMRFSTEIAVYFRNGTGQAQGYYSPISITTISS